MAHHSERDVNAFTAMNSSDFQDQEANVLARIQHDAYPTCARSRSHRAVATQSCVLLENRFVCRVPNGDKSDRSTVAQPKERRFLHGLKSVVSAPNIR
jgi:hypothetical protein